MTQQYNRNMLQEATYWPPGVNDGFGGTSFGSPVSVNVRWQDDNSLYRDATGREFVARAVVYVDTVVALQGFLALGDWTYSGNPRQVEGAHEIRSIKKSPHLRGDPELIKVVL